MEAPLNPATGRILGSAEPAPDIGVARAALVGARAARVVATLAVNPELDLNRAVVQLGALRLPARPTVVRPPKARGASVTLVAQVPPSLLGPRGPAKITPFVLRAPGADTTATVLETYLEITPGPGWRSPPPNPPRRPEELPDAMPEVKLELANAAGEPLSSRTLSAQGQIVLKVKLDASTAQWDTGAVGGVHGVQVYLDKILIAGIPTDAEGPSPGGTYALLIALGGLDPGNHTIEVHRHGRQKPPETARLNFTLR